MRIFIIELLFLLAFLPLHTKGLAREATNSSLECGNDFKCMLKQLEINIPDQVIDLNSTKIELLDMVLYGIDISYINFSYYPDETKIGDTIMIKVQINGTKFNGTLKAPVFNKVKAVAAISNVTFNIPLEFIKGSDGFIENVTIIEDAFYAHIDNFTIKVSGFFANLVKPFIPLLTNAAMDLINNNTKIYSLINPLIEESSGNLFAQINKYLRSEINEPKPIHIPIHNANDLITLVKSPIIDWLRFVLNDLVGDASNPLNFNNLINRFMGPSALLKLTALGKEFGFQVPIVISSPIPESQTTVDFIIKEVIISGINTWNDLSFLQPDPSSPFILDSHTGLGNLKINISTTIKFTSIDINTSAVSHYSQDLDLYTELVSNTMDLDIQIAAPKGVGNNFTDAQFTNIDCLSKLVDMKETGVTKLLFNTTFRTFEYDTKGVLDGWVLDTVRFVLDFFITNNLDLVPKFLNGFIYEYLLLTALNDKLNSTLGPETTCPLVNYPPYKDIDLPSTISCFVVAVVLGVVIGTIVIIVTKQSRKGREKSAKLDEGNEGKTITLSGCQLFYRTDEEASLMLHPAIPLWAKFLVPLLILSCLALFISSNTGLGASVFLKLLIGESTKISFPSMFDFGLINSITEMWQAKSYFLSFLIGLLSCLWPYTKLVIMIIVWILPAHILKVHIRSRILRVLDELGKWSLLDSYVMILMLIAFHISLGFPIYNTKDLHHPLYLNVWVFPAYGFVTLILGTLLSLALSHIICGLNRIAKRHLKVQKKSTKRKGVFETQHWALNVLLVFFLVLSLGCFTCGIIFKSSSFDFVGLAGWFIDLLDRPTFQEYSVIDLGTGITKASEFPDSFAVRVTQAVFFLVTIIVPYVHMVLLFFLLFYPFTKKNLLTFYYVCETCYAWSCLDVFIISIIAAVLEIGQFAFFLVADKCDFLEPIIKKYFNQENYIKGHEKCFEVITRILGGSFFLVAAAIFHTICTVWINIKARRLTRDEEESSAELNEGETNLNDADVEHEMDDIEESSPYVNNIDQPKLSNLKKEVKNSSKNSLSDHSVMNDLVKDSSINVISDVATPSKESLSINDTPSGSQSKLTDSGEKV